MNHQLKSIVNKALTKQRVAFNEGHENSGASIDVLAVIQSTFKDSKDPKVVGILNQISEFEAVYDALKHAKELDAGVVRLISSLVA